MFQKFDLDQEQNRNREENEFIYTPTKTNQRLARIRNDIEMYGEYIPDLNQLSDSEIRYLEGRLNFYE